VQILVDGHNLIGRGAFPDIHLSDPDDEGLLVRRLQAYASRTHQRLTVVFDHGLPGGPCDVLSGGGVQVVFATLSRTADGILRERIQRARRPREITIVTSDRQLAKFAEQRGCRVVPSEVFARRLRPCSSWGKSTEEAAEKDNVAKPERYPSDEEIKAWLQVFEGCGRG